MRQYGEFRDEVIDVLRRGWFSTQQVAEEIGPTVTRQQVRGVIMRLFERGVIMERHGQRNGGEDRRTSEYSYIP